MENYKIDYWTEAVSNSLEENGVLHLIPKEAIINIAKDMINSAECQSQAFGHDCIPSPAKTEKTAEIKRLEKQIKELEDQILCYRQSVATRRGVPLNQVYLDHDGAVIFGKS